VPSLRGASEGSEKDAKLKLVDQRLRTAVEQWTAVEQSCSTIVQNLKKAGGWKTAGF
jgi:hypothetical protein